MHDLLAEIGTKEWIKGSSYMIWSPTVYMGGGNVPISEGLGVMNLVSTKKRERKEKMNKRNVVKIKKGNVTEKIYFKK